MISLSWNYSPYLEGNGSKDPDGWIKSGKWVKLSGPSTFSIVDPTLVHTRVSFTGKGVYIFQLIVTDNLGATGTDTKQITVIDK
ncbi:MAG: hypothetical protein H0X41_04585 [Chitinophagaceae bacterium]|nr:hypothetical protein [Chitinophagaceae bacterium]